MLGNPGAGDAAVLELLPCGSEGAVFRSCWSESRGLDVALCFTLILSASQPAFSVMFPLNRGEGGRGKEEPNGGVMARFLPLPVTLIPWLPMGLARLFKKVIGIKGARAAAASWRGERLRSQPGAKKGGQGESAGETHAQGSWEAKRQGGYGKIG